MEAFERFNFLNKILGWGNSNAKIVNFSLLEEHGGWTIHEILKEEIKTNEDLQNLVFENNIPIEKKIVDINRKLKELKFDDIDTILDKQIIGKENLLDNYGIEECLPVECSYSPTVNFQLKLNEYVIKNYPGTRVTDNFTEKYFGTKLGNSISINYFPLGRCYTNQSVQEYQYLFGIRENEKFINYESEEFRLNQIKTFLNDKIQKGSYLFIFGCKSSNSVNNYANRRYFKTYLEKLGNKFIEYIYRKDSYFVNSSRTIFLLPTASTLNVNRYPKLEDIPKLFNPQNYFVKVNNQ